MTPRDAEIWAELESRAGPSDVDREAWLAYRRRGLSATEASKLAKAPDLDFAIAMLVREKVTGERSFIGNAYTDWGKEREPTIAAEAEVVYGIKPESRVFHHPEEERWLASPDGIRVANGVIELGEYKTSGNPLNPAIASMLGYTDQTQWQMLVLRAERTRLCWEERVEGEFGFYARRSGDFVIEADPDRQEQLIAVAERFLAALGEALEVGLPEPDDNDPLLADLIADLLEKRRAADVAEEYLREYLELSRVTSARTPFGKLAYSWGSPRHSFDREAFEREYPGVYKVFLRTGERPAKRTLRITPPKEDS